MQLIRRKINKFILDLFFPKFCIGCTIEGTWLCHNCFKKIVFVFSQVCPSCERLSPGGRFCPSCRKGKVLKGIICAAHYEEGPIKELIHNFKYNSVTNLSPLLGQMLAESLRKNLSSKNLIITYIPLHPRRQAQRGYNQAELLAKEVAKRLNLPVQNLLKKTKSTQRQVELKGKERRKNLAGVFVFCGDNIKRKTIVIIDDITTTGTTLNECAKVLKSAGAKEVWGLVVARG